MHLLMFNTGIRSLLICASYGFLVHCGSNHCQAASTELVGRNCLRSQVTDGAKILIPERSALDAVHKNSSTAAQTSPSIQLMELYHLRK